MTDKNYYCIGNLDMARGIFFITGEKFYVYDDKLNEGRKLYSFRNTVKFREAMTIMSEARKKLNTVYKE